MEEEIPEVDPMDPAFQEYWYNFYLRHPDLYLEIILNPGYYEAMGATIFAAEYYSEYVKHEIFMPYGNVSRTMEAWHSEITKLQKGDGNFGKAAILYGMLLQTLGPCEYAELAGSGEAGGGLHFDPDQQALIDLARGAERRGGVTVDEAKILLDWAQEYGLPTSKGIEIYTSRHFNIPHIRIGPVNHIPVKMR